LQLSLQAVVSLETFGYTLVHCSGEMRSKFKEGDLIKFCVFLKTNIFISDSSLFGITFMSRLSHC